MASTASTTCAVCSRGIEVAATPWLRRTCSEACAKVDAAAYMRAYRAGLAERPPVAPVTGARAALVNLASELVSADVRALVLRAAAQLPSAA